MQIKIIKSLEDITEFKFSCNSMKDVLSAIKLRFGKEFSNEIIENEYSYILSDSNNINQSICLDDLTFFSEFIGYDSVIIIRCIEGELPVAVAAVAYALVAAAVVAVVVVIALGSNTPQYDSDPSDGQDNVSALFNGAPVIREQGGIVPLIFGAPYCGGVLISSGVYSEEA